MSGFITGRTSLTKVNSGDIVDDAVTLAKMAALADGEMIVGDGTTDPVAESGATLRTSIGLGTGDNAQFTNLTATGAFTSLGIDDNATSNAITISADEEVTMPSQPSFSAVATGSQNNISSGDTIQFNTEYFDQNADYNTGTYTFTAPVTGKYQFNVIVGLGAVDADYTFLRANLVTSNRNYLVDGIEPDQLLAADSELRVRGSILVDMDAADTAHVTVTFAGGVDQADVKNSASFFSGFLAT